MKIQKLKFLLCALVVGTVSGSVRASEDVRDWGGEKLATEEDMSDKAFQLEMERIGEEERGKDPDTGTRDQNDPMTKEELEKLLNPLPEVLEHGRELIKIYTSIEKEKEVQLLIQQLTEELKGQKVILEAVLKENADLRKENQQFREENELLKATQGANGSPSSGTRSASSSPVQEAKLRQQLTQLLQRMNQRAVDSQLRDEFTRLQTEKGQKISELRALRREAQRSSAAVAQTATRESDPVLAAAWTGFAAARNYASGLLTSSTAQKLEQEIAHLDARISSYERTDLAKALGDLQRFLDDEKSTTE